RERAELGRRHAHEQERGAPDRSEQHQFERRAPGRDRGGFEDRRDGGTVAFHDTSLIGCWAPFCACHWTGQARTLRASHNSGSFLVWPCARTASRPSPPSTRRRVTRTSRTPRRNCT